MRSLLFALAGLAAPALAASVITPPLPAAAQPSLPATFYGTASIDGTAPRPGAEVRGFVNGKDCTQGAPGSRSIVIEDGIGKYVIHVVHETQIPGCGSEGKVVTFTIDGRPAAQSAKWKAGPQPFDLNAGAGSPVPLPADSPTATARAATPRTSGPSATVSTPARQPVAATALPTDDIPNPLMAATGAPGTPVANTPLAPGIDATPATARTASSGGGGAWVYLLLAVGAVAVAGGAGASF